MARYFKPLFLFSLLAIAGVSCNNKNTPEHLLAANWTVNHQQGQKFFFPSTFENWQFSGDNRFIFSNANETRRGTWNISGKNVLFLRFQPLDTSLAVDSSSLQISGGKTQTLLFYKGKKIGIIKNGVTETFAEEISFEIKKLNETEMILAVNNQDFKFRSNKQNASFTSLKPENILRGLGGLLFLLAVCYLLSADRRAIKWRLVISGIIIQIIFAVLVFEVPFIKFVFEALAGFFVVILEFTKEGSTFLFGGLLDTSTVGYLFAFQVLPTIIFFSALTSLLYYLGILQKVVYGIAWAMSKTMKLSGAESLSTAANIFLGQTEAPLMVKPYIAGMTRSEILCVMIGGMATIAGGVLAAYVGFLGGSDPEQQKIFATHLLTASVLAAPATIVAAKMLLPETEKVNEKLDLPKEKIGTNLLEAITNGTTEGVKLAINVGAMLLVFTALIAMLNFIIHYGIGEWTGLNEIIKTNSGGENNGLSFQLILGYLFSPIAVAIGIPIDDMLLSGQLLGEKTVLNEFYAYSSLAKLKDAGAFVHAQTIIILTYALCGFANIASIGIQIGGISTMAPNQKTTLSQLGVKALIGGTIACFMTASIAGMFF